MHKPARIAIGEKRKALCAPKMRGARTTKKESRLNLRVRAEDLARFVEISDEGPERRKLALLVAVRRDVESAKRSNAAVAERLVEPVPERLEGASVQSPVVDCCVNVDDVGHDRGAGRIAEGVLGRIDEDSLRRRHADRASAARAGPPRRAPVEHVGEVERLLGAVATERLGEQVRFVLGLLDRLGGLVVAALPPHRGET